MKIKFVIIIGVVLFMFSCNETYTPKPHGYHRVKFPEKTYKEFVAYNKFKIQVPTYSVIDTSRADSGWYKLSIPQLKASLYLTYRSDVEISKELENSRALVYKHAIKADDILENTFINHKNKVFGSLYDIKGNTATAINFHIIDSTSQFFRGALYFYTKPNKDSLAPVIKFVRKDIEKLIEDFKWDNTANND